MKTTRVLSLLLALALLGLVFLALPAPVARANPGVLHVTTSGSPWPCDPLSDWSNPCALDAALTNAVPGDEVWVAAGTYTPTVGVTRAATFQLPPGVAIYGGFAGGETLRTQRNFTVNVTILSGDIGNLGDPTDNAYHVVTGSGVTNTAVLDGFTITGGNANGSSPDYSGAGMYNDNGSPTLGNIIFSSNTATGYGGGMSNNNSSSPALSNVTFSGNSANIGGGMDNYNGSSPTLTNVTFVGNVAFSYGGGMDDETNANPTLTNVTFMGNSAFDGGGIWNRSSSPASTDVIFVSNNASNNGGGMNNDVSSSPMLTRVTFNLNIANQHGGGIYNDNSSSPTLSNVTFFSNTATLQGGGMYSANSSSPKISSTTFYSNSATIGGGMDNESSSSPTITNTTFISNTVSQYGGGMYTWNSGPTLTNVTFSGNSASINGGAMDNELSGTTIRNTILWGNTAPNGSQVFNTGGTPSVSNSVVQGGCPAGSACTNFITVDPLLGPLGYWGGTTQALPLLPGSSAIDAGNDATCATRDQRNITRPQGAHCDIGAFESRRFTLAKTSGDNQSAGTNSAFATLLRVTVSSGHGEPVNGGLVTFAAPLVGASSTPVTSTVIIASGAVTLTLTSNGNGGSYAVTGNTAGAISPVTFTLTNTVVLYDSFLPLLRK